MHACMHARAHLLHLHTPAQHTRTPVADARVARAQAARGAEGAGDAHGCPKADWGCACDWGAAGRRHGAAGGRAQVRACVPACVRTAWSANLRVPVLACLHVSVCLLVCPCACVCDAFAWLPACLFAHACMCVCAQAFACKQHHALAMWGARAGDQTASPLLLLMLTLLMLLMLRTSLRPASQCRRAPPSATFCTLQCARDPKHHVHAGDLQPRPGEGWRQQHMHGGRTCMHAWMQARSPHANACARDSQFTNMRAAMPEVCAWRRRQPSGPLLPSAQWPPFAVSPVAPFCRQPSGPLLLSAKWSPFTRALSSSLALHKHARTHAPHTVNPTHNLTHPTHPPTHTHDLTHAHNLLLLLLSLPQVSRCAARFVEDLQRLDLPLPEAELEVRWGATTGAAAVQARWGQVYVRCRGAVHHHACTLQGMGWGGME